MKSLIQTFPRRRPGFCLRSLTVFRHEERVITDQHSLTKYTGERPLKSQDGLQISDFVADFWGVAVYSLVTPGSRGGGRRVIQQQWAQG